MHIKTTHIRPQNRHDEIFKIFTHFENIRSVKMNVYDSQ